MSELDSDLWLGTCRRAADAAKGELDRLTTRAERARAVGRGEGGDETVAVDEAAEDAIVAELERVFYPATRLAVTIESPFAGDVETNKRYARAALLDSIRRGEAPFAGHLLYTQVLADATPAERELGISCHLAYVRRCERLVVYEDLGISGGMDQAVALATELKIPVETRRV